MKIAVTSQNRKTITEHAGKCRKFWIYEIDQENVIDKQLLELPLSQSFHERAHSAVVSLAPNPLDAVDVLIAGSMGWGLQQRLRQKGIVAVATSETDPDLAVSAWLNGSLAEISPHVHQAGDVEDNPIQDTPATCHCTSANCKATPAS